MNIEHTLQITAICPVDRLPDVYVCRVRCKRVVPVEDILAAVKKATLEPCYQEDLTHTLHRLLAAEVETIGYHSGVCTRVIAGGES